MERVFNDAKDKNVAALMIYGKGSDGKAYVDAACTTQFKTSILKDAFLKRAIINISDVYYVPIGFSVTSGIGKIVYATTTGSSDTAKTDLKTLASVAD